MLDCYFLTLLGGFRGKCAMGEALAHGVQPASGAFRGARGAGVAAVEEQEVVGFYFV